MRIKEIPKSISHCEYAINIFTKTNNQRRLLNTNITVSNQYLKIRNYPQALKINLENLEHIKNLNYDIEKRTIINNIIYIYMVNNDYSQAVNYCKLIPMEMMSENHLRDYMICLMETGDLFTAKKICQLGKEKAKSEYYSKQFNIFNKYFESKDLKKLNSSLIKLLDKNNNKIDKFEIEYLYILISYHFKILNQYKKSLFYLEKVKQFDFN